MTSSAKTEVEILEGRVSLEVDASLPGSDFVCESPLVFGTSRVIGLLG
jgi:hypothetical protein